MLPLLGDAKDEATRTPRYALASPSLNVPDTYVLDK